MPFDEVTGLGTFPTDFPGPHGAPERPRAPADGWSSPVLSRSSSANARAGADPDGTASASPGPTKKPHPPGLGHTPGPPGGDDKENAPGSAGAVESPEAVKVELLSPPPPPPGPAAAWESSPSPPPPGAGRAGKVRSKRGAKAWNEAIPRASSTLQLHYAPGDRNGGVCEAGALESAGAGPGKKKKVSVETVAALPVRPKKGRGAFVVVWESVALLAVAVTAVAVPIDVAFFEPRRDTLFWLVVGLDGFFLLDIVYNFLTPNAHHAFSQPPSRAIAAGYAKTWFALDLLALVRLEDVDIEFGGRADTSFDAVRAIKVARLAKLLHLLRLPRVAHRQGWQSLSFKDFKDFKGNSFSKAAHAVALALVLSHCVACAFRLLARLEGPEGGWVADQTAYLAAEGEVQDWETPDTWRLYLTALHWSVSTLALAGGQDAVRAESPAEKVFASLVTVVGLVLVGHIVKIFVAGTAAGPAAAGEGAVGGQFDGFTGSWAVPSALAGDIEHFFQYRDGGRGQTVQLLGQLPPTLRARVITHVAQKALHDIKLFKTAPLQFTIEAVMAMKSFLYAPFEVIVHRGQVAEQFFLVEDGEVEGKSNGKLYKPGDYFGSDALKSARVIRKYSMRTRTFTSCLVLLRGDFLGILKKYPKIRTWLRISSLKRVFREELIAYSKAFRAIEAENAGDNALKIRIFRSLNLNFLRFGHYHARLAPLMKKKSPEQSAEEEKYALIVQRMWKRKKTRRMLTRALRQATKEKNEKFWKKTLRKDLEKLMTQLPVHFAAVEEKIDGLDLQGVVASLTSSLTASLQDGAIQDVKSQLPEIEHQLSALPHIEAKLQLLTMNQESVLGYMKALIDIANEEGEE